MRAYELTVTCKGHTTEVLYVDVLCGQHRESFGVVGPGPKGRDGGGTVASSPIDLTNILKVKWGVKGVDGLRQENEVSFDMRPYRPFAGQIRAIELVFQGGRKWELKVYDASIGNRARKEIKPEATPAL